LLKLLSKEGIGCIAFIPSAQGLLTDKYFKGIPHDSRAANPHGFLNRKDVTEGKISKSLRLDEIAQSRNYHKWRSPGFYATRRSLPCSLVPDGFHISMMQLRH
jgi:hypothetical protein